MARNSRFWLGTMLSMQVVLVVVVGVLAWYAINTNSSLCSFKADLQERHDSTAAFLHSIETGARQLPDGFVLADLKQTLAAREATLRALRNLHCSPG